MERKEKSGKKKQGTKRPAVAEATTEESVVPMEVDAEENIATKRAKKEERKNQALPNA